MDDGEKIEIAGFSFEVREIPGHSPGSVVFVCTTYDPPFVIGGDVLFAGSIGRTDLGGDYEQLMSGIFAKLLNLPDRRRFTQVTDRPRPSARKSEPTRSFSISPGPGRSRS